MDLDLRYPAISNLRRRARRRIPHFAFEYLDSATGSEAGARRARLALDRVGFMPAVMKGPIRPDLRAEFLGRAYALPVVMAPIGMAGAIWPGAEAMCARAARRLGIPFCQSTVAAATPEDTGPLVGDYGWFQHYPVRDDAIRQDMVRRIRDAGFHTLVVTVDVPAESRRERQRRALQKMPPRPTPKVLAQIAARPHWALAALRHGAPRMAFAESYVTATGPDAFTHAGRLIRGFPDRTDIQHLRQLWDGPLIVKGILRPDDAVWLAGQGIDAIWVSAHAGRQFEAAPAAITQLPLIREAVGPDLPIICDSGVESGLDVLRMLALGADIVGLGRAVLYAAAAFGERGLDHLGHILAADMAANMAQLGVGTVEDLHAHLIPGGIDPA